MKIVRVENCGDTFLVMSDWQYLMVKDLSHQAIDLVTRQAISKSLL